MYSSPLLPTAILGRFSPSAETGSGPAFEPALQLYRTRGFSEGEAFDGYVKSPFNQFLHLDLATLA